MFGIHLPVSPLELSCFLSSHPLLVLDTVSRHFSNRGCPLLSRPVHDWVRKVYPMWECEVMGLGIRQPRSPT